MFGISTPCCGSIGMTHRQRATCRAMPNRMICIENQSLRSGFTTPFQFLAPQSYTFLLQPTKKKSIFLLFLLPKKQQVTHLTTFLRRKILLLHTFAETRNSGLCSWVRLEKNIAWEKIPMQWNRVITHLLTYEKLHTTISCGDALTSNHYWHSVCWSWACVP